MTTRAALIWIILGIGMTCAMRRQWLRPMTRIIRSACRSMRMTVTSTAALPRLPSAMRRLRAEEHNVSPIHISHHASGRRRRLGERHAHWHHMNGHATPPAQLAEA